MEVYIKKMTVMDEGSPSKLLTKIISPTMGFILESLEQISFKDQIFSFYYF